MSGVMLNQLQNHSDRGRLPSSCHGTTQTPSVTDNTYSRKVQRPNHWTEETFYRVLRMWGTDFAVLRRMSWAWRMALSAES